VIAFLAGGLVGLGVSALFGFLLFEPALVSLLRVRLGWNLSSDALEPWAVPLAVVSTLAAGSAFASIVGAVRGAGSRRRSALEGLTLMLASLGGFFFAAALNGSQPSPRHAPTTDKRLATPDQDQRLWEASIRDGQALVCPCRALTQPGAVPDTSEQFMSFCPTPVVAPDRAVALARGGGGGAGSCRVRPQLAALCRTWKQRGDAASGQCVDSS